ncbi:MAG: YsnF/AvaK domain-containing protein [Chloroflexota bacterium]
MQNSFVPDTTVLRGDGVRGVVVSETGNDAGSSRLLLEFEDGVRLMVPSDLLTLDSNGQLHLNADLDHTLTQHIEEMVIPIIEEQLDVTREQVVRGRIQIHKQVEEIEERVDLATTSEDVDVERVAVNRLLDDAVPAIREENGVLIIPLIEEVQVIETRLMLREEIRISKRRTTTSTPESVILRREVVHIERETPDGTRTPIPVTPIVNETVVRPERQGDKTIMRTVIGLFDDRDEAMAAYTALAEEGYALADLDILTNDDKDDEPKLAAMHGYIPEPDVSIYLAGVRDGGTIITANVADSQVMRAAEIMSAYDMVNVQDRAVELKTTYTDLPDLTDATLDENVIEVIEEELEVGKEAVERGRMRIYNVVTEREEAVDVALRDETIKVSRRPVNRKVAVNPNLFQARSFEMVEMDEVAKVAKTAVVVEEVYLGKEVAEKIETIKETLRRQDVEIEEVPAVRAYAEYENDFRRYVDSKLSANGLVYDDVAPAMKFGYQLGTTEPFRSSPWSAVEADAKNIWEETNPGSWDSNAPVVKYAWEATRNMR